MRFPAGVVQQGCTPRVVGVTLRRAARRAGSMPRSPAAVGGARSAGRRAHPSRPQPREGPQVGGGCAAAANGLLGVWLVQGLALAASRCTKPQLHYSARDCKPRGACLAGSETTLQSQALLTRTQRSGDAREHSAPAHTEPPGPPLDVWVLA
jgi:hypothetical protein